MRIPISGAKQSFEHSSWEKMTLLKVFLQQAEHAQSLFHSDRISEGKKYDSSSDQGLDETKSVGLHFAQEIPRWV